MMRTDACADADAFAPKGGWTRCVWDLKVQGLGIGCEPVWCVPACQGPGARCAPHVVMLYLPDPARLPSSIHMSMDGRVTLFHLRTTSAF